MIKPLTLVSGLLMAAAIGHTFEVKRSVAALDRELRDIRRGTEEVEARTQLLAAEWARLNDQERLSALADRHLAGMVPMQPTQFLRLEEAVRRLPVAVAWSGPASPFAPREEGPHQALAAARPAAEPTARPAGDTVARPALAPAAPRPTQPEPPAATRPNQLADAAPRAPRPAPAPLPEAVARPAAPFAMAARPSPAQNLPPVAAPPAPRPALTAAVAPAPRAQPGPQPAPQMQAEARRPPALTAARVHDSAALPAVASPIRPAVLVQRADAGSMLGGQISAMAPPVPYNR